MKRFSMRAFVLVFACLAGLVVCRADELAAVTGLVTDPNGRSVPSVTVIITNLATNVASRTVTNDQGIYRVPSLQPGIYRMTLDKDGFKSVVKSGVELHVQDVASINFELQIGSVNETVTVEAGGLNINTTDATVGTVIDQTYVKNMPLNGRSFQDLILLTPGIVTNSPQTGSTVGVSGEFSVDGQRTESNYYTVDGVSANVGAGAGGAMSYGAGASGSVPGATALGTTQALVSVDDLQEFRVNSSTYSAEYGRNPGGQIAFETKSGTNQWHGAAYDYLRNNVFDANDWFNDYFNVKQPPTRQNDFGGIFGGPVRIPGLYNGKDKTFFFVSYEGLRLRQPQPATARYVPDLCMRGVASQCPSGRNPAASALLPVMNAFPLPSPNGLEDATNGLGQFIGSWSNPSSIDSTSVRFDHAVNYKLRLFFRFSDTTSSSGSRAGGPTPPSFDLTVSSATRTYTGGVSSALSSRLSNEFRINYSSNEVTNRYAIDAFGGSTPVDLAQLVGHSGSFPLVLLINGGLVATLFQGKDFGVQRQWNLVDTTSLALGRHQLKFGVDYRRLAPFLIPHSPVVDFLYFGENAVEANSAFVDTESDGPGYPLYTNFSAFAQDEWKLSPRLSVSLGLRWEVNPAPGVTQGVKPYTIQGSGPSTWALAPQGTPLWRTTWYNFAPRLGVAYILRNAPGRETVVRGGGGVFYDTGQQEGAQGFTGAGFVAQRFQPGSFPGPIVIPTIVNPPVPPYNAVVFGFAAHLQLPYTVQWNGSVEQALGRSQALTVSYVGSHATRLLQQNHFAPSNNPNASTFYIVENGLTSDYDSLQVQFRRRLSRGLTALASYTWSHCLDYGSTNLTYGYQRGNCDFDVRHNFSAAFSYDLPNLGRGGFVNAVLHHWGLDDRFTVRSGFPVTLTGNTVIDPATAQQFHAGLNLVPGQPVYLYGSNCDSVLQGLKDLQPGKGCPGGRAINPSAFMNLSSGFGDAPRNFARGFGAWQMNLAVRRDFPIYENLKLQFRAEAFNIFNHPNFGLIDPNCGGTPGVPGCTNATFGQATATVANSLGVGGLSPLYQMGGPRSMQFALKLVF